MSKANTIHDVEKKNTYSNVKDFSLKVKFDTPISIKIDKCENEMQCRVCVTKGINLASVGINKDDMEYTLNNIINAVSATVKVVNKMYINTKYIYSLKKMLLKGIKYSENIETSDVKDYETTECIFCINLVSNPVDKKDLGALLK